MPKSFTLSNGNLHIGLDQYGQLYDLYFPYVGLENHVGGRLFHKVGVYVNGAFSWIDDGNWNIEITSPDDNMTGVIIARNEKIGIELRLEDTIYNEKDIYIRKIDITNFFNEEREVKLYINQQFEIYESHRGDTAYFDPINNVIIHYKGRRVFVINALKADAFGIDDYSIGLFGIEGREGTYKDAEDGILSKNPIEHGFVDSTVGFTFKMQKQESQMMYYWIAAAKSLKEALEINNYVIEKEPYYLVETTQDYWNAWVHTKKFNFQGLSPEIISLFNKSLLMIRSHVDNRGAIIASSDSDMLKSGRDTYSYMWPRDGALTAYALDKAGYYYVTQRFYTFCRNVITDDGYFMHKYRSDESLGSSWHPWVHHGRFELPIQEDETALVLRSLWNYYDLSKNLEFVEDLYNPLIKKAADFLASYVQDNGLPKPSYDLWEEHFCVSTFTACSVYAGLESAAKFAKILGKNHHFDKYSRQAQRMRSAILENLFDEKHGHFIKMTYMKDHTLEKDTTLDISAVYAAYTFGVLDVNDSRIKSSIDEVQKKLKHSENSIGGVARYENDHYYRASEHAPENPWIITSLWLAQYYVRIAEKESDFKPVIEWLAWTEKYALPSGVLSEQLDPFTGKQISAAPLTWSHAEFILTVLLYLEKLEELGICKMYLPSD
jgi:GH15 family glucan-1,4-alpha-glucosidase